MKHGAFSLILLIVCSLAAQTPSPTPVATLEELEATYRANLMKMQLPIMQQYVKSLQAQLAAVPEAEKGAFLFEIARINDLIANDTPIDMRVQGSETEHKPVNSRGIYMTLDPDETIPPLPKDKPIALGSAVWPLSRLPPGTYELTGFYACPDSLPASPVININYHGINSTFTMTDRLRTKSATSFRPITLCRFTLNEVARKENITITASGDAPWIFFKQLRLEKMRE